MIKKVSITMLATVLLAVAIVMLAAPEQVVAQCEEALIPTTQTVFTDDGSMTFTVDPCSGMLTSVVICNNANPPVCHEAQWVYGEWCIGGDSYCRPWTVTLPSGNAIPATYSNIRCYSNGVCR